METTVVFDGSQPQGDVGHFRYDSVADYWSWSEGMYAIHGYGPGEVPATTGVLLQHKHPDDRERAAAVLENVLRDGGMFSCYHRVIDQQQRAKSVLSVGRALRDQAGRVVGVDGYFVDLTAARRNETETEVHRALEGVVEHRAAIDQAIGMIVAATGCSNDEAFGHLRQASHTANIKLNTVAHQLVESAGSGQPADIMALLEGIVTTARELGRLTVRVSS